MEYKTADGQLKNLGDFGNSTQKEFDDAISGLPALIALGRNGNAEAGLAAHELLWKLANESFNTRKYDDAGLRFVFAFGNVAS